jgi:PPOX class probable F420-dependent enzyme
MRLEQVDCRARFGSAEHAVLAVNDPAGPPLVVPIAFALLRMADGIDVVTFAVDHKPKSTPRLRRLRLLAADPRTTLLVEHYQPDWQQLWWVRAEGLAQVLPAGTDPELRSESLGALQRKYPQYRQQPPTAAVVRIRVTRWGGWSAATDGREGRELP